MPLLTFPAEAPLTPPHGDSPATTPRQANFEATTPATRERVRALLATLYLRGHVIERRREQRYPFPLLITLTPLAPRGGLAAGPTVIVVGKHISECGLGFYHPAPLPYRRVLATIEGAGQQSAEFVMDLSWCRFLRQGWYESGGRFLENLPETAAAGGARAE